MIILYTKSCETCNKSHNLKQIERECLERDIKFQQRITLFFEMWEQEAKRLEENFHIKQPFVYNTETKKAIQIDLEDVDIDQIFQ
nr:MAG TPA: hypothetical protein [Bacteriophage sp.]